MSWEQLHIRLAKALDARAGRHLVSLALWLRALSAKKPEPTSRVRKILFIKFWGIGSIILSEPALQRLRARYPDAELHYLTLEQNRELFGLIPIVDKVHSIAFSNPVVFLWRSLRLVRTLSRERYDLAIDAEFFANFSLILARAVGAGKVVGFAQPGSGKKRWLDQAIPFSEQSHAADQFLRLVGVEPAEVDLRPQLRLPEPSARAHTPDSRSDSRSEPSLPWEPTENGRSSPGRSRDYVVMNVNASSLALERRWPRDRFAALGKSLLEAYDLDLVLVGAPSESAYVRPLAAALGCPDRVRNLAGGLTLMELARLIRGSSLFISNDSGPIHMAAALGVPVVGFYGPETPVRYGPLATQELVFYLGLWCSPCMSLDNAKTVNCINELKCMKEIETDDVVDRVRAFLEAVRGEKLSSFAAALVT